MGLNEWAENSWINTYFKLKERGTNFTTELRAGTVSFITVAYIIAVAPALLADTGGPCSAKDCTTYAGNSDCMLMNDEGYEACVTNFRRTLVTATALLCAASTAVVGVLSNLPLSLCCGMGLLPSFSISFVGHYGTGPVSYSTAVTAVMIEGLLFMVFSVSGVRYALAQFVPRSIMMAVSGGIGIYLAHCGLQPRQGIGLVTYHPTTLVTFGGCAPQFRAEQYTVQDVSDVCANDSYNCSLPITPYMGFPSSTYACTKGSLSSGTTWLGLAGVLVIAIAIKRNVQGAIMMGMLFVTFIAWIPGHDASYFGANSEVAGGAERLEYFKQIVSLPVFGSNWLNVDFSQFLQGETWLLILTMLVVDVFDTMGTLYAIGNFMGMYIEGFVDDEKEFPGMKMAFALDGFASIMAGMGGISPITTYGESAAGIKEGGRTGLTAIFTSLWFLVSMFFAPIFANIPPYATGPALIIVGVLMTASLAEVNWMDAEKAIPAFLTVALMPLTFSITFGILSGIISYIVIKYSCELLTLILGAPKCHGSDGDVDDGDDDDDMSQPNAKDMEMVHLPVASFSSGVPMTKLQRNTFTHLGTREEELPEVSEIAKDGKS